MQEGWEFSSFLLPDYVAITCPLKPELCQKRHWRWQLRDEELAHLQGEGLAPLVAVQILCRALWRLCRGNINIPIWAVRVESEGQEICAWQLQWNQPLLETSLWSPHFSSSKVALSAFPIVTVPPDACSHSGVTPYLKTRFPKLLQSTSRGLSLNISLILNLWSTAFQTGVEVKRFI